MEAGSQVGPYQLREGALADPGRATGLFGGVEAGGTKVVVAVGTGPDDLRAEARIPTTTPDETLARVVELLAPHAGTLEAVGVGSFGPLDLDPASPTFGSITTTPKPGWAHVDLRGRLSRALGLPVAIDTDVNAAALAEHRWGAAQDVSHVLYLTVGTGIGGGALIDGRPLHGLVHPEMGHVRLPRARDDAFVGACPYHGDCLEGLASGPALARRWGRPAEELPDDHPAWPTLARELGLALATFVCALSPQRIVIGGGVAQRPGLLPLVRAELARALGGYVQSRALGHDLERYVVPPGLGGRSGVLGALALAASAGR